MNTVFFQLLWQGCPEVEKFGGVSTMFLKIFLKSVSKVDQKKQNFRGLGRRLLPRLSSRCRDTSVFGPTLSGVLPIVFMINLGILTIFNVRNNRNRVVSQASDS
jgi:hypothetical protein